MRVAVLEASKRLEEEQQRRAREEMRREQARSSSARGAGLVMRHGGELSADAIKQFVIQQQKEEQKKVQEATKRAGRRHARNRTASDIRGMFGSQGSELGNLTGTLPKKEETFHGAIPDFSKPPSPRFAKHPLTPTSPTKASIAPDLPELPLVRNATKPGQFRKTNYDPFSFGVKKSPAQGAPGQQMLDSSLHRHLDAGLGLKKQRSDDKIRLDDSDKAKEINRKTVM